MSGPTCPYCEYPFELSSPVTVNSIHIDRDGNGWLACPACGNDIRVEPTDGEGDAVFVATVPDTKWSSGKSQLAHLFTPKPVYVVGDKIRVIVDNNYHQMGSVAVVSHVLHPHPDKGGYYYGVEFGSWSGGVFYDDELEPVEEPELGAD